MSTLQASTQAVAEAYIERLDYHLRGAYRAGYDYLYLAKPRGVLASRELGDTFRLGWRVEASNLETVPFSTREYTVTRFDLNDISPSEYREAVRQLG